MSETVDAAVKRLTIDLAREGVDNPRLDARVLVGHVLGLSPGETFLRGDTTLSAAQAATLEQFATRRRAREPVSRILGHREFWGLDFVVNADTLDPRPDTEALVSAVLDLKDRWPNPRVLDLGTGTGCILISILNEWPTATGIGVDISAAAIDCAAENARRLGVGDRAAFTISNWADDVGERYDIVVANPPYLSSDEMAARAPEVMFDPPQALGGGADGLDAYRKILGMIPKIARLGAVLAFEIGAAQGESVAALIAAYGLKVREIRNDLAGQKRCILADI